MAPQQAAPTLDAAWWSRPDAELFAALDSSPVGLTSAQAQARLALRGPHRVTQADDIGLARLLWRQVSSPLVLILVVASALSLMLRDWIDAATILTIIGISALLGVWQEWHAGAALARLRSRLALRARVRRDGDTTPLGAEALVPGDVIELRAGQRVPADGRVLEARDCLVNQASLTGESMPVDKRAGVVAPDAPLAARSNCVYLGSSVVSGSAVVLIVRSGRDSVMADVAARIGAREQPTEFERGVREFGALLMRVMLGVVVIVLTANALLGRPPVQSLLFALALAVGLSPELLPAIVGVSLSRGARALARAGVLVRRLDAIEDLGGMDLLCTDKTGTLTLGTLRLVGTFDASGGPEEGPDAQVLRLALLNAALETGIDNPMDDAIVQAASQVGLATTGWRKVDEIPYDFVRRCLTVVVTHADDPARHLMVTKGAVASVLDRCTLDAAERSRAEDLVRRQGEQGVRVLALATREMPAQHAYARDDERALNLVGFLCFADPLRPDAPQLLRTLARRGVAVKIISGDNRHVVAHVAQQVGLGAHEPLTGDRIDASDDEALQALAERHDAFAEVEPAQKERIVRALQRGGHAVGYLGDGINDAPALHAADVGISVDAAVDVARESADIVMLRSDLAVLAQGIALGRQTFANTLKYIRITTSANFGNMVSMALATPLLPFLPLTATQILLNNFLSDLPALAISADRVDAPPMRHAQRWHLAEVRRFMLVFGLVSSAFDLLAFAVLVAVFDAGQAQFHSAWFVVSLLTELAVVLVLRTERQVWRSRPSRLLATATIGVALLALALPYSGAAARVLGLVPLPAPLLAAMLAIVLGYVAATEAAKRWFWRAHRPAHP